VVVVVVAATVGTGAVVDTEAAAATEVSIFAYKVNNHVDETLTRQIGGANAMPLNNRRW